MSGFSEVSVSYDALVRMYMAAIRSKLLLAGIELKVFNHLSTPRSDGDVARSMGTHPRNTGLFLDSLAAVDLVEKREGKYRNTQTAETFLVEGSPTYLGGFFTNWASWDAPVLTNLAKLVTEGPPPTLGMGPLPDNMVTQYAEMHASVERTEIPRILKLVSELPEFPAFTKMLDLGGGPGLYGIVIVAAHPTLRGVNFDLPPMARLSEAFIKKHGMEDRMSALGGDFNRDPIGEGYDLVLASGSLHNAKDIDTVVQKVYDALNPGGVFIALNPPGFTREGTKPEITVLNMLSWALMGQDTSAFHHGFVADAMLRAGFTSVRSRTLEMAMPMELVIARK